MTEEVVYYQAQIGQAVTTPFLTQLIGRNNLFFILYGAQVIE